MHDDQDARDERRRIMDAARQPYFVPTFEGHWVGVVLFAGTLVGAAMLWSGLPMALAVIGGGATGAPDGRTAAIFLTLYAAMAVGPIAGWTLWIFRRRWAALAVMALFFVCVAGLNSATL